MGLQSAEKALLEPIRPPHSGRIHPRSVARTPFRTISPRTRVNYRWGPSFSNSLLIEIMAPPSTAGNHPLFSYI